MSDSSRNGVQLVHCLRYLRIEVEADEGRLRISAPPGTLTDPIRDAVRTHKAAVLEALSRQSRGEEQAMELPLSFEQERVWLAQQLAPKSALFNLALAFDITGPMYPPTLAQALTDIVYRHEVLRTVYRNGVEPTQAVKPPERAPLAVVNLASIESKHREGVARRLMSREAHRPFDLTRDLMIRAVLMRLAPRRYFLLIVRHHIAADGWSLGLFLRDVVFAYEAFRLGRPAAVRAPAMQYARYAVLQRLVSSERTIAKQLEYWRSKLQGADPTLFPQAGQSDGGAIETHTLAPDVARRISNWCRDQQATVFSTYLAAFLIILQHRSGRSDLLIGTDYASRDSVASESVIGMFVRRLPLRCQLRDEWNVLDLVRHLQRVTFEACSHASVPLEQLATMLGGRRSGSRLFQVMFGMHGPPVHAPYRDLNLHGTQRCELLEVAIGPNEFPLNFYISDAASGPVVELRYDTACFASAEIKRLLLQYEDLLKTIGAGSRPPLQQLTGRLVAAERDAVAEFSRIKSRRLARRIVTNKGARQ